MKLNISHSFNVDKFFVSNLYSSRCFRDVSEQTHLLANMDKKAKYTPYISDPAWLGFELFAVAQTTIARFHALLNKGLCGPS